MPLVSSSGLVEENALQVSHHYGVNKSFLVVKFQVFFFSGEIVIM